MPNSGYGRGKMQLKQAKGRVISICSIQGTAPCVVSVALRGHSQHPESKIQCNSTRGHLCSDQGC